MTEDGIPLSLPAGEFAGQHRIDLPGRHWTLRYRERDGFVNVLDRLAPLVVLLGGGLACLFVWFVARTGARWRSLAGQLSEQARGLSEARFAAEAATRAKSDFLANMSHEIRTPLNAIIGTAELMAEEAEDEEQKSNLATIGHSSEHLLGVINDILDFSKIEAGMMELDPRIFDLRATVEDALELAAPAAARKGLDLALDIAPGTPEGLRGDPQRLKQVLVNFVSNAIKFTAAGEVELRISSEPVAGSEGTRQRLHFAVRDTGIGIPPERMDRLFKSFSQVDSSTTRHFGGTGLGLAISKRLAELMGGTAWAESRPGVGSTFHFTIVAEARSDWGGQPPPATAALEGKRLLVVDDNDTNRRLLCAMAESWRMQVRATATPAEALEWLARGESFDLAILDYLMPGMDGRSLARAIRGRNGTLPLILASSAMLTRQSAPEFAVVLAKPLRRAVLHEAMTRVLTGKLAPGATTPEPAARSALAILLVEDNETNQKVTLQMLRSLGYAADIAANGARAVEAVQRRDYDLVLMDMHMPEMDGPEATRRIRALPLPRQPRIFALTASVLDSERQECLDAGMERHIAKPVQRRLLAEALASVSPAVPVPVPSPLSPAAPASDPLLPDAETLASFLEAQVPELEREGVAELVGSLIDGCPPLLDRLRESAAGGDANTLRRVAHTLKANAALAGAMALSDEAAALEAAAKQGSDPRLAVRAERIATAYSDLIVMLVTAQKGFAGPGS